MASFGPVVLSYGDSLIRKSEIEILSKPSAWLNDVLLSFYLEYLENSCKPPLKDRVKCYAATISQFIKLCSQADEVATFFMDTKPVDVYYAFWPINDGSSLTEQSGTHWSLLVYSKPDAAFIHYDSVKNSPNSREADSVARKLALVFTPGSYHFKMMETKEQQNWHDCGLHVLGNAERILEVIKNRLESNQRLTQLTSKGSMVLTVDYVEARNLRSRMIDTIQRLGGRVPQQVPALPPPPLLPRLPAPQNQVPAIANHLPGPLIRPPQLHAPPQQNPGPQVDNVQRNLAHMSLI